MPGCILIPDSLLLKPVCHHAAAPGMNGVSNDVKPLPNLSKTLWDSWIFLHQTYIFFFQKWKGDERDILVTMGTQCEVFGPLTNQSCCFQGQVWAAVVASVQVLPLCSSRVPGGSALFILQEEDEGQITVK